MKTVPDVPAAGEASLTFEESLKELEKIVQQLESPEVPLEAALALFEKGVALSDSCRSQLEAAETRVEILLKRNGRLQPAPFPSGSE